MEIISVQGIVVSSTKYKESSKILNILTKDKGIIGVISKGSLKPKSKLRIISNNYVYANFNIYYCKNKLCTLISGDVIDYFLNINNDIIKLGYMAYLVDLSKNIYNENPNNEIYDILINSLLKINEGLDPKIITNIVEIKLLDFLGVGLSLNGCSICNNPSITSISISKGGYVCLKHRDNEELLDINLLKMFKAYKYIDISKISELNISDNVSNYIDRFLTIYYKDYTGIYLKSKEFLNNIKTTIN